MMTSEDNMSTDRDTAGGTPADEVGTGTGMSTQGDTSTEDNTSVGGDVDTGASTGSSAPAQTSDDAGTGGKDLTKSEGENQAAAALSRRLLRVGFSRSVRKFDDLR